MTTYTLRKGSPAKTRTDLVVIGVAKTSKGDLVACPGAEDVASEYGRKFKPMLSSMGFKGDTGEVLRVPTGGAIKAGQLLVVGLGQRESLTVERVRRAAGVAARNVGNAASVALALPAQDAEHVRAVADGFLLGSYSFKRYKSRSDETAVADVSILSDAARRQDAIAALDAAQAVADVVRQARDWVNTPPNDLTPELFADGVLAFAKKRAGRSKPKVEIEVLGPDELAELGCGGILGVGLGSANPPRLVKLTWAPEDARAKVAFVGKGITYDSGGLTIKPGSSMATMKYDMGGAAAVIAATFAIAALELPVSVTTYAPMAENMVSGSAMRPGDVLTMFNGKTVEVTNTDAEGRLILADAIAMAAEDSPDAIIDVATLTGPCIVALGEKVAGIFGDDETTAAVAAAAETSGEMLWRLPIPDETREAVRTESKVADVLQHNWVRWGSALFAAAFLEEFIGGRPWAHLDIAGPAWNTGGPWGHVPSGATGYSISTLVEYVAALAAGDDEPAEDVES
ncbi:leucyl aminopeptidase [Marmoricola sp. URHB0036]|uniref:leucyl aminopeptidase n=1 Tax=Marmoricola sp. URHB0036 TaxID=1298863 RepID=UPI0003FAE95D|nr:leucyl aminopeptidase [Marmoricola sp. URHB0036]